MEYVNELYKLKAREGFNSAEWQFALEILIKLLAPFAPHIAEELWQELGNTNSVHTSSWPIHDEQYLKSKTMIIVVQINGKVRANIDVSSDSNEEQVIKSA